MQRLLLGLGLLLVACGSGPDGDTTCVDVGICGNGNRVDSPSADGNAGTGNTNAPSAPHDNPTDNSTHTVPTPGA